jgi:hypothetical protein
MGSRRCSKCDHLFFAQGVDGCRRCGCTNVKGGVVRADSPTAVEDLLRALGIENDPRADAPEGATGDER